MGKIKVMLDDMVERRVLGKLATLAVPFLLAIIAYLIAPYFGGSKDVEASVHEPTLQAAKNYHDKDIKQMQSDVAWMAATIETKWNVRRPEVR